MASELTTRSMNPFKNWCDWSHHDESRNENAVITFITMQEQLWNTWQNSCVSHEHPHCDHGDDVGGLINSLNCDKDRKIIKPEKFDADDVRDPGSYRDQDGEDLYTVILPSSFMSPEYCQSWLDKLNAKFGTDYVLKYNAFQAIQEDGSIAEREGLIDYDDWDDSHEFVGTDTICAHCGVDRSHVIQNLEMVCPQRGGGDSDE